MHIKVSLFCFDLRYRKLDIKHEYPEQASETKESTMISLTTDVGPA